MQVARQGHLVKALIEFTTKSQTLQVAREGHLVKALIESKTKSQTLTVGRQGYSCKAPVERRPKSQFFQALREMVQILRCAASAFYLRDPFQCKLLLRDFDFVDITPCTIQICWNESAGERRCPTQNALLLQRLVKHQR